MPNADRQEKDKTKEDRLRAPGQGDQQARRGSSRESARPANWEMAPTRDGPSTNRTTNPSMADEDEQPRVLEPLPDSVARPSREEIFSFPHSKRVGSYILGKTLGEGAFAKVKEGRHLMTGEKVAVKVIDKKKAREDPYVAKNMRREAKLMMMVLHPNILKLLEVVETDNSYYLVTEMAEGGDLMDRICRKQFLPEDEVRRFIKQIVSAVDYLHRANIVHRDLKIENLLLDSSLNIKIIDFGLSNTLEPTRSVATLTAADKHCRTQCGSPAYAAPELLGHSNYGPSVDVWSIGVNMYAMLTGSLPYTVEPFNITELHAKMISNRMNPLPDHIKPSPECRDLLLKLLNPNPEERISLPEVFKHPWLNQKGDVPFLPTPHPNFPEDNDLDDRIMQHMIKHINCSMHDITRAMTSNRAVHVSACYTLLAKRLERYEQAHPKKAASTAAAVVATTRKLSSESNKAQHHRTAAAPTTTTTTSPTAATTTTAPTTDHQTDQRHVPSTPSPAQSQPTHQQHQQQKATRLDRPMEAGAAQRRRSQSEGNPSEIATLAARTSAEPARQLAGRKTKASDSEATDKCMPLNDGEVVIPVRKSSTRRHSISGSENAYHKPGMKHSMTTGQLKPGRPGMSRTSPNSPASPSGGRMPEHRVEHRVLEKRVQEAFERPGGRLDNGWLMADGDIPGPPDFPSRVDYETNDLPWQNGPRGHDRHRAKSGPSSKIHRANSFRDDLLRRPDSTVTDLPIRRTVNVFAQANGDVETFPPKHTPGRRSSGDGKAGSTLPAIPRHITSAGKTRSHAKPLPQANVPAAANGTRPHTTAVNGRRVSAGSKVVTAIDGLSDLPPDAVMHEVIRVLRNLRVEDWRPKGYEAIHCVWHETEFEIAVVEDSGMCRLTFERVAGSGTQMLFRDACDQIISALRVNVAV